MKIGFTNTYDNAKKFFSEVLVKRWKIEVVGDHSLADILIFGDRNFGEAPPRSSSPKEQKRVFFTGENQRYWDYDCDFAVTFDFINSPNHYRLPLYVLEMYATNWDSGYDIDFMYTPIADPEKLYDQRIAAVKNLSYIQSNPHCQFRTRFVELMLERNAVDCGGPHLNNIGHVVPRNRDAKIDFISKYLYNVAFENGAHPGYVTEKLLDAYYAQVVPIYWGSKLVHRDFNPKRMIDANEYQRDGRMGELIEFLTSDAARDKQKYLEILSQPVFVDNRRNEYSDINNFLDWFQANVIAS
jgi:alpha(1,3/1,4) fucosyltransferase